MRHIFLFVFLLSAGLSADDCEPPVEACEQVAPTEEQPCEKLCEKTRWYFELQPGYFFFTNHTMRTHFDHGGFTGRGEIGYRFWKPLTVFVDGGYFQKHGQSIGGGGETKIQIASLTVGLKAIYYFHEVIAGYLGAGPRLFMVAIHNYSSYVRGKDEAFALGGGFKGGFWVFPFYQFRNYSQNIFFDVFGDFSLKTIDIDEDEMSSEDYDVNINGFTFGLGVGLRF